MSDEAIRKFARDAGIAVDWIDADDRPQRVSISSLLHILAALDLPAATPAQLNDSRELLRSRQTISRLITTTVGKAKPLPGLTQRTAAELLLEDGARQSLTLRPAQGVPPIATAGYHTLRYLDHEIALAVAPPRCLTLADILLDQRAWGLAVQLYSLKRRGDGGIGDTTALSALAKAAADHGADALAISPVHALFPSDLARYGPYSPASRVFFNPLLADPANALGAKRVAAVRQAADVPDGPLVDWPRAASAKYALLRQLFDDFARHDIANRTPLAEKFAAFVRQGGAALDEHARLEARQGGGNAPVPYHAFLQWISAEAFASAQSAAKAAGMRIGLIADLAVGLDRNGTQAGARPQDFLNGLSIGAPPDLFNPRGQDWGLTTFSPQALVATGFEPFIATLRANMSWCGGVRVDHAMGLMRLWLVPQGASPSEGAYLAYPLDDLLRLLALESHRHGTIVIGEDLGTVPPDFRRRCREAGIAGMDVLWFQRARNRFMLPAEWREDAVAMTTTHDLPTVAGWWRGTDLALRRQIGTAGEADSQQRTTDRALLWRAFTSAGVVGAPPPPIDQSAPVVDAALGFVAETPDPLALVPLEDVLGLAEQPNLPGTIDEHPNWRRRFAAPADELLQQTTATRRLGLLNDRRS